MGDRIDLLMPHLELKSDNHLLINNISDVASIQQMSEQVAHVAIYHSDCDVLQNLEDTFKDSPKISIHNQIFPDQGSFDAAVLYLPVSPGMGKGLLTTALQNMVAGGRVWAAGHAELGGKAAFRNAGKLGSAKLLEEDDVHVVFEVQRDAMFSIPADWGRPWQPRPMTYTIREKTYHVHTQPGIFSWDRLETGASHLINHLDDLELPIGGTILDAGCGYGLLGMVVRDHTAARKTVWVDKSLLAVHAVRESLPDEAVICADLTRDSLETHGPFDLIFCNPPFYDPYKVNTDFMRLFTPRVPDMLTDNGQFLVVTREIFQFDEFMIQHFPHMQVAVRHEGYCIMQGWKNPHD